MREDLGNPKPMVQAPRRIDWFLIGMLAAVALVWLAPELGARGGPLHPELTSKLGVAVIFLLHGLTLSLASLRDGMLLVRLHLVVQLTTFLAFPLLGLLLHATLESSIGEHLAAGVFYLCALPSTVSSSVALTAAARGNVAAALFNATLSSLLGVVLTPLWVGWVLGSSGHTLPLAGVVIDLLYWLILPLCLGQLLRLVAGASASAWTTRHKGQLGHMDRVVILLLVYTTFCESVKSGVWRESGAWVVVLTLGLSALLLSFGLAVATAACRWLDFSPSDRIAAIFCGSKKSLALGVPMAGLLFSHHPALSLLLLPILVYHSLQLFVVGLLATRLRQAGEHAQAPDAPQAPRG